ncbi:ABC transporter-like protein [Coleophoma cylindrospora]|uniref:ABC transporter-like protein n=1 Tax=Coleophoma cylindrospora TaxID=1849047 RepID=A0A3D8QKZ3_9HELO|nr:ABC transporter-like protein [Coleophoma cylindrospora]
MEANSEAQYILNWRIQKLAYVHNGVLVQSSRIWDPINARFERSFLPVILAIPAVVAACVLLGLLLQLLPKHLRSPKWTRNFIEEPIQDENELESSAKPSFSRSSLWLLVLSSVGLVLRLARVFHPEFSPQSILSAIPWAVACIVIAVNRPRNTPKGLLIVYGNIFVAELIILIDGDLEIVQAKILAVATVLLAFGCITVILSMPMRDPALSKDGISPVFSPPTAELRSPEDDLTLWQYMTVSWMSPLISLGNKRQLNDDDVWSLNYEFQHRMLHDRFRELPGSVLRRLMSANGIDLVLISLLSLVELLANYSTPVLLQKILQSMEDIRSPKKATFIYAGISLIVRLVANQAAVFNLWYGRRAYERSRGEMITMLYEKTLSRKVVTVSGKEVKQQNGDMAVNGLVKHEKLPWWKKASNWVLGFFYKHDVPPVSATSSEKTNEAASMGKIMNLMRFDAYEVAQRFWEFNLIITQPLGLLFSVILIWQLIGWPCLFGVVTVFFAQAINALIARALLRWEKERRLATDAKIHKVSQLVEAIRHLRYYGWQDVWLTRIMEARQHELWLRVVTSLFRVLISFTNSYASGMFPVAAFLAYTAWAGQPLRVDIAFPALQLFSMLENSLRELPNLITVLLNAKVAVGRLEEFMHEPNKADAETNLDPNTQLELKNASFAWAGVEDCVLKDITLSFPTGLTVVCGEVGAGKSALLQALLGELDLKKGEYHRSGAMVGYCAQTPWLQSMSIRENILFSSPYDEKRYKQVLEACALVPDMANFKDGDLSMVGENGIGLSGGQKSRVSLARAMYSVANTLFLDDPLSALDHQTADLIVRKCLTGPLADGRTIILVTHRTELCLGLAKQVVEISDGRASIMSPDSVPEEVLHRVRSSESLNEEQNRNEEETATPEKFMDDEHRAHGGVKAAVYWEYIKAGKLKWWFALVVVLALNRLIDIGETWFLKQWGEAYDDPVEVSPAGLFDKLPSPEENIKPWLIGFFLIATAQAIAFLISQGFMTVIIYKAGKKMFEDVMVRVTHATFRFYDVTPVGRLMNRLTSDINTVDGNISNQFQFVAFLSISWIASIIVIASVTPLFLIFAIALTIAFIFIFLHFLPTSQSLRRLEMVSLSPLISNFGALTDGLTTIRAYCAQYRFQDRVIAVTDNFQKMDHFYWSLQAWLMYRFDNLSACSTFLLTALALYTDVSPGLTAFLLIATGKFVMSTHALCKCYGQLQMDFVSVERIVELLHLDQEPPGSVQPPAWWPSYNGDIVFENVTMRYAPHLDPALTDVSLTIKGGSMVAMIGRTGSGKSTLALSLLATTLPSSGRILIDGIDIAKVDTQALRKRVTFLAQEPVLFPGSMRQNLDPLDEYSDEECSSVLAKIAERHQWTLSTPIESGGHNLSQGQRQLVGLARALLRRSPIVIMDEATASIDAGTAMRIQEILREEMKESTVITIAHRVEAVKGADFAVVLGKGKLLAQGPPGEMMKGLE